MATSAERMRALRERAILHDNSEAHTGILDITVKPLRGGKRNVPDAVEIGRQASIASGH